MCMVTIWNAKKVSWYSPTECTEQGIWTATFFSSSKELFSNIRIYFNVTSISGFSLFLPRIHIIKTILRWTINLHCYLHAEFLTKFRRVRSWENSSLFWENVFSELFWFALHIFSVNHQFACIQNKKQDNNAILSFVDSVPCLC